MSSYLLTIAFLKHVSHFNRPVLQQEEEKITGLTNNDVKQACKQVNALLFPPTDLVPGIKVQTCAKVKPTKYPNYKVRAEGKGTYNREKAEAEV